MGDLSTYIEFGKVFLQQGVLGAVTIVALWWAYKKDKECKQVRDKHEKFLMYYLELKEKVIEYERDDDD